VCFSLGLKGGWEEFAEEIHSWVTFLKQWTFFKGTLYLKRFQSSVATVKKTLAYQIHGQEENESRNVLQGRLGEARSMLGYPVHPSGVPAVAT